MHDAMCAGHPIDRLVTFAPPDAKFLAHPISVMRAQADAMGLPHQIIEVGPDARADYRSAISQLGRQGITALVTGDIDRVQNLPNFVQECCEGLDMEVLMPLWQADRLAVLQRLVDLGFEVVFSLVKEPWFSSPDWIGRRLDPASILDLQKMPGVDACGENGEYHTLVLDAPMFKHRIELELGPSLKTGNMFHLNILRRLM
jgi:uncharacterized protein (TIGR00290 family)